MNYYLKVIILSIIFAMLDIVWIMFLNKDLTIGIIEKIQKEKFQITNIFYYAIAYFIMTLGLFTICISFVETQIQKYKNMHKYAVALLAGGFYGFIINGVYNFTALSAYKDYSLIAAIVDMCWASLLYGTISMLYIIME